MHDTTATARAAALLGVDPAADRATVRRAFRDAVRLGRPDLGGMSGEHLGDLLAARDALLAAAPASVRPAGSSGPTGPHARRFDMAAPAPTGRLVDLYA